MFMTSDLPLLMKTVTGHPPTYLSLPECLLSPPPASLFTVWSLPTAAHLIPDAHLLNTIQSKKDVILSMFGTPWMPQTHGRCRDVDTENKAVILKHPSRFHVQSPNRMNLMGPARVWQQLVGLIVLGAGIKGWTMAVMAGGGKGWLRSR